MIAQQLDEPVGLEGWQLMVVPDQQATAGQHEWANEFGTGRLSGLLHNHPVELLPGLYQPLNIGRVRCGNDDVRCVKDEARNRI